jgi:predicted PurR-regulated permease PerM
MREPSPRPAPRVEDEPLPSISRGVVVEICIIGLFLVALGVVLYIGKPLFMPLVAAFIVGITLSPAASWLEERRIPRALGAVLMVGATFAILVVMIGLITAPLPALIDQAPQLAADLRNKLRVFDGLIAGLRQVESALTGGALASDFRLPRIEWMQPTLEYVSPTIAELVLFVVTLLLFVASWPDVRRRLILAVDDRKSRLRTVRIVNAIETRLGSYLALVSVINVGVGVATGLIALATGMPNPAGLAALAAALNFIPIIGPVAMFIVLLAVGLLAFPTVAAGLVAPALFALVTFIEGHFLTPAIIGRRLALNALTVFAALAFWTWMWGPMGAFLASPILIVLFILQEHLFPDDAPQLPDET